MRYIGSKTKIVSDIASVIDSYGVKGTLFDAFAGSGAVSNAFKDKHQIIACDILMACYIVTKCSIMYTKDLFKSSGLRTMSWFSSNDSLTSVIEYLNTIPDVSGYVTRSFTPIGNRKYFTEENGGRIDAITSTIHKWFVDGIVSKDEKDFLLGCLLESISLIANIAGTYGSFNKKWDPRSLNRLTLKNHFSLDNKSGNIAHFGNSASIVETTPHDILYLDPPYNKRQYGSYYHVIETIARNDEPELKGITGLRDWSDTKSNFCSNKASDELRRFINSSNAKLIVMSYNNEGILTKQEIETILGTIGDVKCVEIPYKKYNSGRGESNNTTIEYIFSVLRPDTIGRSLYVNNIFNQECIEGMQLIPSESIDMILTDLPYGLTECKWDSVIPLDLLWIHYKRVIKPEGAIVLFGQQPFTSRLIMSNPEMFKYSLVWKKSKAGNFAQAPYRFLCEHEDILVFSFGKTAKNGIPRMKFNPQGTESCNKKMKGKTGSSEHRGGRTTQADYVQTVTNYPRTILEFANEGTPLHPTQKPVDLCEYLIKSYTNEGDIVLDSCMGSGTTAVACNNVKRLFVGFELDVKNFELCRQRLGKDATRV
jgi:adenine-specific DNA methylase/DNA modification methylase